MTGVLRTIPFNSGALKTHIDDAEIKEAVLKIQTDANTLKGNTRSDYLLKAISLIDLTSLAGNDTAITIDALCKKAVNVCVQNNGEHCSIHTAAVCVYPSRISDAIVAMKKYDPESKVAIASVAGGFPSGQFPLETRVREVELAVQAGATEIDIVIDRSLVLNQQWNDLYNEIKLSRDACGDQVHLKTILSTGELGNLQNVYKASMVAMMAGSDFIKTSTGKEAVNATLPVGLVITKAIKDYKNLTGRKVGFKPAGGIGNAQQALEWMVLIEMQLGSNYLSKDLFRIGASSLLDKVVTDIEQNP